MPHPAPPPRQSTARSHPLRAEGTARGSGAADWLLLALEALLARPRHPTLLALPPGDGASRSAEAAVAAPVIWLCGEDSAAAQLLESVAPHLTEILPGWHLLATPTPQQAGPGAGRGAIARFLDRIRPGALVLGGNALRPALVIEAAWRKIPIVGVALRAPHHHWLEHRLARPLARRLLGHYTVLLAQDAQSLSALRHYGAPLARLEVGGQLSAAIAVPRGNAAEARSLTELMAGRPLWCAAALPLAELPVVAAAHRIALAGSHRLLLVVVPARVEDADAMREMLAASGLACGLRSAGEDPEEEISAYVADIDGELGLWLRLAPVTFQGGTLTPGALSRSPLESAALGSAILHGPEVAPHASDYARLAAAGAARQVAQAEDLAHEVDLLMAPDQAAIMAHAAWEIASAGEGAAELLAARLADILRERRE